LSIFWNRKCKCQLVEINMFHVFTWTMDKI